MREKLVFAGRPQGLPTYFGGALRAVATMAILSMAAIALPAQADYQSKCAGCHAANGTPEVDNLPNSTGLSGSIRAANNRTYLDSKITDGMGGFNSDNNDGFTNLTAAQRNAIVAEIAASNSVAIPVITSTAPPGGNFGNAYSKQVTATAKPSVGSSNLPAAFTLSAGSLPPGLTLNSQSGLISGTPTNANFESAYTGTIRVDNKVGTDTQNFSIVISRDSQTITFNPQNVTSRTYSNGATFSISPTATTTSGLTIAYSTSDSSVCTVSGTTVTMQGAGTCTLRANQAGSANYDPATQKTQGVTINPGNQTVTFGVQTVTPTYSSGGTFTLNPVASATSGLAIVYASTTPAVCTKPASGTTVNIIAKGTCTITASQPGNSDWNAASNNPVTRSITIAPQPQTITFNPQTQATFILNDTFTLTPAASTNAGLAVSYASTTAATCSVANATSPVVTMLAGGTCTIHATQAGNANVLAATAVDRNIALTALPGAPTGATAAKGDGRAVVSFSPPDNPETITQYTATCSAIGQTTRTGTSTQSPIVVTLLTNGITYNCTVKATNAFGTGLASNIASVTPDALAFNPVILSAAQATFEIGKSGSFQVVGNGKPLPNMSISAGSLPSGLTFSTVAGEGTATISGIPAAGTANNYALTLRAQINTPFATQAFTLTVNKGNPVVTFGALSNRQYSASTFGVLATIATSSGPISGTFVAFTSATLPVCTVAGNVVTLLQTGTCTINAGSVVGNATYNASYNAATPVPQSFQVTQASQTINFAAQTTPSRVFVPGATFAVSPLATATSGLAVDYSSGTPSVCGVVGTTVTMINAGTCTILAGQDGNANFLAAADAPQSVTITKASQSITFPVQGAQSFASGGNFALTAATASSGLAVSYVSNTTSICTVSGATVTMVTVGTCLVTASQTGDSNYNAATPVQRSIAINAALPGAPSLNGATASDGKIMLEFTAPGFNGGSAITGYRGTCNPGAIQGTSVASPVAVEGLTNGVPYTCSVQAINVAGTGPASNTLGGTPFLEAGSTLWSNICSTCHGVEPAGVRFNAAGTTSTVLKYVRSVQPLMLASAEVQNLTGNELAQIAQYIDTLVPPNNPVTPFNTPVLIDVSNHLTLGTVSFETAEVTATPLHGTLSMPFSGTTITYTPNPGYTGTDTFSYQGYRSSPDVVKGDSRTITITVSPPSVPVITSAASVNGTFGVPLNYQITATNSPTSYGATGLPGGASFNAVTGLISHTPGATGTFNIMVSATNAGGTGSQNVMFTIDPAAQSITFGAQPGRTFSAGGTFPIAPTATASSALAVVYSTSTPGVCSVAGTTVTMLAAGTCTLVASQPGNANYNAALPVPQDVIIAAAVPGAPVIGVATPGDTQATLAFAPPSSNGGSPITSYSATCTPTGSGSNASSPITVSGLTNGVLYTCSVKATNAAGTGAASSTVGVTPSGAPAAPSITSNNATTFTVLSAGNFAMTASGNPAPTLSLVGALPTGVTFTPATGMLAGTPAAGTVGSYPLTLSATNASNTAMQSFTLTVQKANQTISFTNPGAQTFSASTIPLTASATSGLAVTIVSTTPAVCSVAGTTLTMLTVGICSLDGNQAGNANFNAASTVTRAFSISQAGQTITFPVQSPATQNFSAAGTFPINPLASASSGLSVAYSSTTPSVCAVSGTTVTISTVGTCTIAANQGGNSNFAAATQVTRNVTIAAIAPGAPVIGTALAGNAQATISFTPPANNGGSAITQYAVTCNPGNVTATGAGSPIVVGSLTNDTLYSCSVKASNLAGQSVASGIVTVTPSSSQGPVIWQTVCNNCHTLVPSGTQLNAAGTTGSVINHVRGIQPLMLANSAVQALSPSDLADISVFIAQNVPVISATVPFNTATPISVSSHITLSGQPWSAFTLVETVAQPAHGTLSAFTGTGVTYTPTPGYVGPDSFTYRGRRSSPTLIGETRTVNISVSLNTFQLTVARAGNGGGNVSGGAINCGVTCSSFFGAGSMITLTATPDGISNFTGWTNCPSPAGNQCTLTMNSAASLTATFDLQPTEPDPPDIGAADPGDGMAGIHFTPPAYDGGSPITSYTATCMPGNFTATGSASPIVVPGLTNGVDYNCSVTASNAIGESFSSPTVSVTPAAAPIISLVSVLSRKSHGGNGPFNLTLNQSKLITDDVTVESRVIGAGHLIVFTFDGPVTIAGTASATNAAGSPVGSVAPPVAVANEVRITLTGIADNSRAKISLTGVNGAINVEIALGFLVGDVNSNGAVNAADISAIKARQGVVSASNFLMDVNVDGQVNAADSTAAKARAGYLLP